MHLIQNIKRKTIAHHTMILLAAITLSTAAATDALAAGRGGGAGGHGGGGRFGGGQIGSGFTEPVVGPVPSMPSPVFNPSSPYTVAPSPETPVSPASPGSIFGNG